MKLIYDPVFLEHDTGMHPENRKRIEAFAKIPPIQAPNGEQYLELIHTPGYIENVKRACAAGLHLDPDTMTSPGSYEAAIRAVGATIMAAEQGDFALARPPGHHAYPEKASGFCLFNNVSIAAEYLARQGKKVLICDFDGHLGDGTSAIFYKSPQVMYWSLHQFPAFPGHGWTNEIGEGPGRGYTLMAPLPPGSGDDIFMNAFESFLPIAEQFAPDVVAVSAGFDAHQYDLLLELRTTAGTYYRMGALLRERFSHIFATLEGGYNIEELPKCVDNFVSGINGAPMPHKEKPTETSMQIWQHYELNLQSAMLHLHSHWKF
jgi:acetoin utilization deacetylase AcuC-like enzyme